MSIQHVIPASVKGVAAFRVEGGLERLMTRPIEWTFGHMEAQLGGIHGIASGKRTAFQSRLKNFHRRGYPIGFKAEHGKTAFYSPGQVVEMALALELTQLGLPPERVIRVLTVNWFQVFMCVRMAARELLACPYPQDYMFTERPNDMKKDRPSSFFLFFDPTALAPLQQDLDLNLVPDLDQASDTFFYGGEATVADNFVRWTTGLVYRLSLINVTTLIDQLVFAEADMANFEKVIEYRKSFFSQIIEWADRREDNSFGGGEAESDFLHLYFKTVFRAPSDIQWTDSIVQTAIAELGADEETVRTALAEFLALPENGGALIPQRDANDPLAVVQVGEPEAGRAAPWTVKREIMEDGDDGNS